MTADHDPPVRALVLQFSNHLARSALDLLTTEQSVGIVANMKAELLINERHVLDTRTFAEIVVWHLPRPTRASTHRFKYRLALVVDGVLRAALRQRSGQG
jgi:hypothetical protein